MSGIFGREGSLSRQLLPKPAVPRPCPVGGHTCRPLSQAHPEAGGSRSASETRPDQEAGKQAEEVCSPRSRRAVPQQPSPSPHTGGPPPRGDSRVPRPRAAAGKNSPWAARGARPPFPRLAAWPRRGRPRPPSQVQPLSPQGSATVRGEPCTPLPGVGPKVKVAKPKGSERSRGIGPASGQRSW